MTPQDRFPEIGVAARWLRWSSLLLIPLYPLVVAATYAAFLYAPTERQMGEVQRIFYFHVGAAFNAFLAFFIVFVAGICYLMTRRVFWDQLAAASVEVGVVFTTIVLTTGPIWAKPVWNTWFPWGDPRVMTTLVLWLIYIAYLILRSSLPEGERKYKFCAVFGIIGFIDVPIVWMSIRWWRTIHPVVITSEGANLEPEMLQALLVAVAACFVAMAVLVLLRATVRLNRMTVERLEQELLDRKRVAL
jgi:heme exporter protein C